MMIKSTYSVTDKTSSKINEESPLNFYLSSKTISNFKYEPTRKQNLKYGNT